MFNELGSERSFNIIDDILVEEALKNAESEEVFLKIRLSFEKHYTTSGTDDPAVDFDYSEVDYLEPSDEGYDLPFGPLN
jgi:hypothetical protein